MTMPQRIFAHSHAMRIHQPRSSDLEEIGRDKFNQHLSLMANTHADALQSRERGICVKNTKNIFRENGNEQDIDLHIP